MTSDAGKLLTAALELSPEDRADLAAQLIDSLDAQVDSDAVALWDKEIRHRVDELDNGKVKSIPWHTARQNIIDSSDEKTNN